MPFATTSSDIPVNEMLGNCVALAAPQAQQKQIDLRFAGCDARLVARADRAMARQVVINLLGNAVKFTAAGGGITLAATSTDDHVVISVVDTGPGIPANMLESIFEPFVRVASEGVEGTGLGLAISRKLARAMGGDVTVKSSIRRRQHVLVHAAGGHRHGLSAGVSRPQGTVRASGSSLLPQPAVRRVEVLLPQPCGGSRSFYCNRAARRGPHRGTCRKTPLAMSGVFLHVPSNSTFDATDHQRAPPKQRIISPPTGSFLPNGIEPLVPARHDSLMTSGEFAIVVGADPKWIRNARRTLRRSARLDEAEARWLSLVHELHASLDMGLCVAARIADEALAADATRSCVEMAADRAGTLTLTIDLARARSLHALRYAHAMYLSPLDQRGRPATSYRPMLEAVRRRSRRDADVHILRMNARGSPAQRLASVGPLADILGGLGSAGVRFVVIGEVAAALFGALRRPTAVDVIHDAADDASLRALAVFLEQCDATPRGAPPGKRLLLDARLLGAAGTLALETPHGALNLVARLDPIGDYAATLERALEGAVSEFDFPVLGLPAQMVVQRYGGRTVNAELRFELQELERERQREARRLSRRVRRP